MKLYNRRLTKVVPLFLALLMLVAMIIVPFVTQVHAASGLDQSSSTSGSEISPSVSPTGVVIMILKGVLAAFPSLFLASTGMRLERGATITSSDANSTGSSDSPTARTANPSSTKEVSATPNPSLFGPFHLTQHSIGSDKHA